MQINATEASKVNVSTISIKNNFLWSIIGNVIYGASQWGILVILAKLGSPEMVGIFTLSFAICAPVIIFANLQLRNVQSTDADNKFNFIEYLGLRIVTLVVSLVIIFSFATLMNYPVGTTNVILAIGFAKAIESISDVIYGRFQRLERLDIIAKSLIFKGVSSVLVISLGIYFTNNLFWTMVFLSFTWIILLVFYDLSNQRNLRTNIQRESVVNFKYLNIKNMKKLLYLTLPLGIAGTLDTLNANIPRYFIEKYVGVNELGYFSAIVYIMIAGSTVVSAIGQSTTPRLANYYSFNLASFKNLFKKLLLVGVCISLISITIPFFWGSEILRFIYTEEYSRYTKVFQWSMIAAGIWYISSFLECGIYAIRNFKVQTPLLLCVVLTTILSLIILLPKYGILGASISMCIGMLVRLIGGIIIFRYLFKKNAYI